MKLPPGFTISKTPSMLAGWMPWKWIVCGCALALRKSTRRMSSSVARMTGPGAVPLYVHAGIEDALGDLDLPVLRDERVLADATRARAASAAGG